MTELKTLKDFEGMDGQEFDGIGDTYPYKHVATLRAEAIKWIKSIRNYQDGSCEDFDYGTDLDGWIKHFFNISEEDLK